LETNKIDTVFTKSKFRKRKIKAVKLFKVRLLIYYSVYKLFRFIYHVFLFFFIQSGLAYDLKYSPNLYWSESDTNNIWYVDTSTLFSNRIFLGGQNSLVKPRDIIVLPNER
jgi:hypothetical protein